jgi:predicted O-linked N-acetylglucosamine transferase (SPINDLY family)
MEIDIAVDLKGFTQDARPSILAFRPVPLQLNYLGHPGTMGAPYVDYIVADRMIIPAGHEAYYSEKIVYLPDSYQANDAKRRIAPLTPSRREAGLPETGFVFCSFNSAYKIAPEMFDVWTRLLKSVEGSVLWLLDDNPWAVRNLRHEAEARGVAPSRLIFAPRQGLEEHLARQSLADLFLDTLPCNAHTTASDALWAGLPVLTCIGTTFAGRVGASLLSAIALPELITDSLSAYEARALSLAQEPSGLAAVKAKLLKNRDTTPLFDTGRFTRNLEAAYISMLERQERGEAPASFAVKASEQFSP